MGCSDEVKVTTMVLKVDLDCYQCYKKTKKVLCKFPQIRDQVFDEKQNTVTITVVCCSPERIMAKICSKGGKSIKSIEIKPAKPSKPDKPSKPAAPAPAESDKPKPQPAAKPDKPKPEAPPQAEQKPPEKEKVQKNGSKKSEPSKNPDSDQKPAAPSKKADEPAAEPKPAPAKAAAEPEAQWVPGYPSGPPPQVLPVAVYYGTSYDGRVPDPCYQGYEYGYGYGYGRPHCPPGYYGNRYDYISEENPGACSIM